MRRKKNKATKKAHFESLPLIHPNAAGIDVGSKEHLVAVPLDRDPQPVRTFQAFTPDLHQLAAWLKRCGIETVALESTGIYWISLYEVLEQYGFEVRVVNARHVKNVPGRSKSDVLDCQWIRKLHSFGLLNGSFRPDQQVRKLRTYMRLKDNLVVEGTQAIHHMQKALFEMNVQLSNVISDITGESGLRIIEAILAGERDPEQLAAFCSTRIKASRQTVAKSLHGNWDEALLFCLKTALETYRFSQKKIQDCDQCIERQLATFESKAPLPDSKQKLQGGRWSISRDSRRSGIRRNLVDCRRRCNPRRGKNHRCVSTKPRDHRYISPRPDKKWRYSRRIFLDTLRGWSFWYR